jgi:hypothetical protein
MLSVELVPAQDALGHVDIRDRWSQLLASGHPLNRIYASPEWMEHLLRSDEGTRLEVCIARNRRGAILAICPLEGRTIPFNFDLGGRVIISRPVPAKVILGGEILGSLDDMEVMPLLSDILHSEAFTGLYIDSLPVDSPTDRLLRAAPRNRTLTYSPGGTRPWHWIALGGGFDHYVKSMNSKTRYTIRRKIRVLEERGGGDLSLWRIETADDLVEFLRLAAEISSHSWQHQLLGERIGTSEQYTRRLGSIAKGGMLRSYVLSAGERPVAFLVGYQHDGVFQYADTGFDARLGNLSPGAALLYLVLEDLCRENPPGAFNFGVGDGTHKRRFGNRESADRSAFIFEKTSSARLLCGSHEFFRRGVVLVKKVMNRRVAK